MKRHRFDPFSFVFGALFLVVGATFLFGGSGLTAARPVRMWPAGTIVVGVALAVWAVARAIHREPRSLAAEAVRTEDEELELAAPDAADASGTDASGTDASGTDASEEPRPV